MSSVITSDTNAPPPKSKLSQRLRNSALSLLGLGLGYLVLIFSTAFLYWAWLHDGNHSITPQFLAFSAIYGVVVSTLGGYIAGVVAQRKPVIHASLFALMLVLSYLIPDLLFGFREPAFVFVINCAIAISGAMIGGWFRYWQIRSA